MNSQVSVAIVLDRYVEQLKRPCQIRMIIRKFTAYIEAESVEEWKYVTPQMAFRFRQHCVGVYSAGTAASYVATVKRLYNTLQSVFLSLQNPFRQVKVPVSKGSRRRYHARLEDPATLLGSLDRSDVKELRDLALLSLLFGGALRFGEAVGLDVKDLSADGKIYLHSPKEGRPVRIQLPEWVFININQWLDVRGREAGKILCSIQGKNKLLRRISVSNRTINARLELYCKRIGAERITSHSGRVTAITRALEQGFSLEEAREFARHSTVLITECYDRRKFERIEIEYD